MSVPRPNPCIECSRRVDRITWGVVKEQQALHADVTMVRQAVSRRLATEEVHDAVGRAGLCEYHLKAQPAPAEKHWTETDR